MTDQMSTCTSDACAKKGVGTWKEHCSMCGLPTSREAATTTDVGAPALVSAPPPPPPAYAPPATRTDGAFARLTAPQQQPRQAALGRSGPLPNPKPVAMWINAVFLAPLFGLGLLALQFQFARNFRRAKAHGLPRTRYVVPWLVGFWPVVVLIVIAAANIGSSSSSASSTFSAPAGDVIAPAAVPATGAATGDVVLRPEGQRASAPVCGRFQQAQDNWRPVASGADFGGGARVDVGQVEAYLHIIQDNGGGSAAFNDAVTHALALTGVLEATTTDVMPPATVTAMNTYMGVAAQDCTPDGATGASGFSIPPAP
jgi:hypothetical protein